MWPGLFVNCWNQWMPFTIAMVANSVLFRSTIIAFKGSGLVVENTPTNARDTETWVWASGRKIPAEGNGELPSNPPENFRTKEPVDYHGLYIGQGLQGVGHTEQHRQQPLTLKKAAHLHATLPPHLCNPDGTEKLHTGPCQRTSETTGLTSPTLETTAENILWVCFHTHSHTLFPQK